MKARRTRQAPAPTSARKADQAGGDLHRGIMLAHAQDIFLVFDDQHRVVDASKPAVAFYGYTRPELLRLSLAELQPSGQLDSLAGDLAALARAGVHRFAAEQRKKDGSIAAVDLRWQEVEVAGFRRLLSLAVERPSVPATETQITRITRLYRLQSRVSETLVRAGESRELLREVCRILVTEGQFAMAWVGFPEPGTSRLRFEAQWGDDGGYLDRVQISTDESPTGLGPSGRAFRENRPCLANDFLSEARTQPWRDQAAAAHFYACASLPIRREGRPAGVLTVYARERGFFGPQEMALLDETCASLSFALEMRDQAQQRQRAESELSSRNEIFAAIVNQAGDAIVLVDAESGRSVEFNRQAHASLGLERDDFARRRFTDLSSELAEPFRQIAAGNLDAHEGDFHWPVAEPGAALSFRLRLHLVRVRDRRYVTATWNEVTKERRARERLRASEERYRLIAENTSDVIWLFDLGTRRFAYVSPGVTRALGYEPAEMLELTFADLLMPADAERAGQALVQRLGAFRAGDRSHRRYNFVMRQKSGAPLATETVTSVIADSRGEPAQLLGVSRDISDRVATENQLRRLSLIAEQSPASVVLTDLAGNIEYVNWRFTELTGYTLEEVRGKNPRILKSDANPPGLFAELWQTITTGGVWRGEIVNRNKRGELFTELVLIAPITDAEGHPTGYVALKEDITERKRVDLALLESERRFREITETVEDVFWSATRTLDKMLYISPAYERIWGRTCQSLYDDPRSFLAAIHNDDQQRVLASLRAQERGAPFEHEYRILRPDGTLRWIRDRGFPVRRADGSIDHYIGSAQDVTERKRVDLALLESERRFREITETVEDVFWSATRTLDKMLYISPAYERIWGRTCQSLYDDPRSFFAAIHDDDKQRVLASLRAQQRGAPFEHEYRILRPDGTLRWIRDRGFPVRRTDGSVEHYIGSAQDITARREIEDRYRLIAENSGDIVWLYDLERTRFTYISPAVEKLRGYRPEEVIGTSLTDSLTPESAAAINRELPAWLAAAHHPAQRTRVFETQFRRRDGGVLVAEVAATVVHDAKGRPIRIIGTTRDIGERKRAEEAVRASEQLLTAVFENAEVGIYYAEVSGKIARGNQRLCTMLGYSIDELRQLDWPAFTHPDDRARQEPEMAAVWAGRSHGFRLEKRYIRKDGSVFWGKLSLSAVRGDGSELKGLVIVIDDITQRVEASEALQRFNVELEARVKERTVELGHRTQELESLLSSLPDLVLICDGRGTLLHLHAPKRPSRPAAGNQESPRDLGTALDGPTLQRIAGDMLATFREGKGPAMREFDGTLPGLEFPIEARATPIDQDRTLVLVRDITEQKRLERTIVRTLERERELSNLKSHFIAVASHEFRTPLSAAAGSAELLARYSGQMTREKQDSLLGRLQKSLDRLVAITNDVLLANQADVGLVTVNRVPVNLPRYVQDVIHEAEDSDRHQHPFVFRHGGSRDTAPTDTHLLQYILSNLLSNAVRYSPPGTPITVTLEMMPASMAVIVADEGIGVPAADRANVFEPFYRGSNVLNISGTGLGLNIVKRYTELLGGRVQLLDTPAGAAFRVEIPDQNTSP